MKNEIRKHLKEYGINSVILNNALRVFIAFIILIAILLVISYNFILNVVNKKNIEVNSVELQKIAAQFEEVFRNAEYTAAEVVSSPSVDIFMSTLKGNMVSSEVIEKTVEILDIYSKSRSEIAAIFLYNKNINTFFTKEGIIGIDELDDSFWVSACESPFYSEYKIIPKFGKKHVNKFVFIKEATYKDSYIVLEIDATRLRSEMKRNIGSAYDIFIVQNNEIVFTNSNEIPDSIKKSDFDETYCTQNSKFYDFNYILKSKSSDISDALSYVYRVFSLVLFGSVLLAMAISIFISLNGMNYIFGFIDLLDKGQRPKKVSKNEIKYITDKIIYILDDNEELKKEIENRMVQYNELKRNILQMQIKPHFINNSLNAIDYCVLEECGYDSKSSLMISKFSEIISYNNTVSDIFVPLWREADYIQKYMEFLQYRYDGISFEIYVSEKVQNVKIPKMCLQPLVENSVFHGIGENGGMLKISCKEDGDKVLIEVYDNGEGMTEESIANIKKRMDTEEISTNHIGITNVYGRIKLLYGESADIEIVSELEKFTCIKIYIPK